MRGQSANCHWITAVSILLTIGLSVHCAAAPAAGPGSDHASQFSQRPPDHTAEDNAGAPDKPDNDSIAADAANNEGSVTDSVNADAQAEFTEIVTPFLMQHCIECHSGDEPAGDRTFAGLDGTIKDDNTVAELQDIVDQLNLGEMPPRDAAQPGNETRQRTVDWLSQRIATYHRQRRAAGGVTVLRRMNSREYHNTVRDLLHLNMTMFRPTATFPREQRSDHLDNIGQTLVTSGYLLSQYLAAAESLVDKAMRPLQQPALQTWEFKDGFRQQPEIDQVHRDTTRFEYLVLYDVIGADKHEGAYAPIHAFADGVPHDGYYELHFKASAVNRNHPYDDQYLGRDRNEPLRLGIVAGNRLAGPLHKPQPIEPLLAELDLQDGTHDYSVRVWLDAGFTPRFTFINGLMDARNLWTDLHRKYPQLLPKLNSKGIVETRRNAITHGKLPQIHVDDIRIRGPYFDQWPTESQRMLLGEDWTHATDTGALTDAQIRSHLLRFASRAFRRPANADEIDRLMQLVRIRQQSGQSALHAYADAVKAILCSPAFLYLDQSTVTDNAGADHTGTELATEPGGATASDGPLSSYALATRLSMFLWASMPDDELLALAADDRLQNPDVISTQLRRMLSDPRSDAFIDGFLENWIALHDLGSMPPDRRDFADFYQYDLGNAMKQETRLFTRHLLQHNLPIHNFLDSDFTFVNKALARHYGLDMPTDHEFQRVELKDHRRGGLLGQGSVLTITANGIDTSPVVRGVWLLDNILGTPASPPPPDVKPLDPDVRGATTIREQLARHRTVASCNDCHRKIDPLGFALENFDPIGRWRSSYGRSAGNKPLLIDASGELPNGKTFLDITGLKQVLLEQHDQFALALSTRLLAYSMGRLIEPSDRPHLDQILAALKERGNGFCDLLELVVLSDAFRSR